ncbi:MAG: glutaredoxin domain-containing protein [Candidatus Micrarchaeota archaeon]
MAKVIVYTKDDCTWCVKVEDFLKQNNIAFEERNAQRNPEFAKEVMQKSGGVAMPVTDIDGTIIIGFNPKKLKELLKLS